MDERMLPVTQKAYDLLLWLVLRVERFPRAHKFTLGDRLETAALDLNLALLEAGHAHSKERVLHRANRLLDQIRILLRLARDLRVLTPRQHEYASGSVEELGRMVGGWLKWSREGRKEPALPSVHP